MSDTFLSLDIGKLKISDKTVDSNRHIPINQNNVHQQNQRKSTKMEKPLRNTADSVKPQETPEVSSSHHQPDESFLRFLHCFTKYYQQECLSNNTNDSTKTLEEHKLREPRRRSLSNDSIIISKPSKTRKQRQLTPPIPAEQLSMQFHFPLWRFHSSYNQKTCNTNNKTK